MGDPRPQCILEVEILIELVVINQIVTIIVLYPTLFYIYYLRLLA